MKKIIIFGCFVALMSLFGVYLMVGDTSQKNLDVPGKPTVMTGSMTELQKSRLTISGSQIIDPTGQKIVLRGYNWGGYNPGMTAPEDPKDIKNMGGNVVRIPLRWRFEEDSKQDQYSPTENGYIKESGLRILDEQIREAGEAGVWVVIFIGSDIDWKSPDQKNEFHTVWKTLAKRYKDTPYIAGYELLSEPHPGEGYTNEDVKNFYLESIQGIREIDTNTPIIVGAAKAADCSDGPYDIRCLELMYLGEIDQILYTFNFYEPPQYVKGKGDTKEKNADFQAYPGVFYNPKTKQSYTLDATWIRNLISIGKEFSEKYQVPVFVNQIGVASKAPGSLEYTRDTLTILNEYSIGYTWWKYRASHTKNSLLEQDRGILWQDAAGNWYKKEDWIELMSLLFKEI